VSPPLSADGVLPGEYSGTSVSVNGVAAPLVFVSGTQIDAVVPFNIGSSTPAELRIRAFGYESEPLSLPAGLAAPALFTADGSGKGQAAALNQDGTLNSVVNPASAASIVTVYGTGLGATVPISKDGVPDGIGFIRHCAERMVGLIRYDSIRYSLLSSVLSRRQTTVDGKSRLTPFVSLALFVLGTLAQTQSVPGLRPPAQTYIYDFNGSAAIAPVAPRLNLGASFSIEFWMMLDRDAADSQYMRVLHKGIPNNGDPFTGYELDLEPGTHQLSYSQSTGNSGSSRGAKIGVALAGGQWYHVAIVSDNLQVTLYLNGQQQARFTAAGPPPVNSFPLVLAAQAFGDGTVYCCGFRGGLRQFRIWGRALPPTEIATVATKLMSGTEAGLIADWPLDEGQGTAPRDVGPNHLALTLLLNGNAPGFPTWRRTAIVDQGPVFQVQRLTMPVQSISFPRTIPIDFDSDGATDLLVCQSVWFTADALPCAAFRNDGKGNFSDVTKQVLGPNPPRFQTPRDFCIADFNGDGRADVFITDTGECPSCTSTGGQSVLLLQTADGRLQDATAAAGLPQQRMFTHNVACGDVDGDGDVDLYYQNFFYQAPALFLNDGRGHFTLGEPDRLPPILRSTQFAAITAKFIDVNHDGRLDLYVGLNHAENQPHDLLLLNDGHGFFTLAPDNALPNRYGGRNWGTVCIQVVDYDNDGWPDLINAVYGGPFYNEGAVQILLNNRDGTFRDATDLILQPAWQRHGSDIIYLDPVFPADFNGDGFIDLLVHGSSQPSRLFLNTGPSGGRPPRGSFRAFAGCRRKFCSRRLQWGWRARYRRLASGLL
jgi:hypothetical protein